MAGEGKGGGETEGGRGGMGGKRFVYNIAGPIRTLRPSPKRGFVRTQNTGSYEPWKRVRRRHRNTPRRTPKRLRRTHSAPTFRILKKAFPNPPKWFFESPKATFRTCQRGRGSAEGTGGERSTNKTPEQTWRWEGVGRRWGKGGQRCPPRCLAKQAMLILV